MQRPVGKSSRGAIASSSGKPYRRAPGFGTSDAGGAKSGGNGNGRANGGKWLAYKATPEKLMAIRLAAEIGGAALEPTCREFDVGLRTYERHRGARSPEWQEAGGHKRQGGASATQPGACGFHATSWRVRIGRDLMANGSGNGKPKSGGNGTGEAVLGPRRSRQDRAGRARGHGAWPDSLRDGRKSRRATSFFLARCVAPAFSGGLAPAALLGRRPIPAPWRAYNLLGDGVRGAFTAALEKEYAGAPQTYADWCGLAAADVVQWTDGRQHPHMVGSTPLQNAEVF
jgi:hypothetical protein